MINCITSGVGAGGVVLLQNGQGSGVLGVIQQSNTSVRIFDLGAVDRSSSNTVYQCLDIVDLQLSAEVALVVQCE